MEFLVPITQKNSIKKPLKNRPNLFNRNNLIVEINTIIIKKNLNSNLDMTKINSRMRRNNIKTRKAKQ